MHRDIKPENILLESLDQFDTVKLIGFDCATEFKEDEMLNEVVGALYYTAPEVIL